MSRRIDPEGEMARALDRMAGRVLGSDELERIADVLFGPRHSDLTAAVGLLK